jgi:NitT/TauT family transport system ATP-binding protein
LGVAPEVIRRTLDGRLKVAPSGEVRRSPRYLLVGRNGAARPDPVQAAWLYAQMVRWGQAPMCHELLTAARGVFRPDLYDAVLGPPLGYAAGEPADGIGAFAGPAFNPTDLKGHLAPWRIKRTRLR